MGSSLSKVWRCCKCKHCIPNKVGSSLTRPVVIWTTVWDWFEIDSRLGASPELMRKSVEKQNWGCSSHQVPCFKLALAWVNLQSGVALVIGLIKTLIVHWHRYDARQYVSGSFMALFLLAMLPTVYLCNVAFVGLRSGRSESDHRSPSPSEF